MKMSNLIAIAEKNNDKKEKIIVNGDIFLKSVNIGKWAYIVRVTFTNPITDEVYEPVIGKSATFENANKWIPYQASEDYYNMNIKDFGNNAEKYEEYKKQFNEVAKSDKSKLVRKLGLQFYRVPYSIKREVVKIQREAPAPVQEAPAQKAPAQEAPAPANNDLINEFNTGNQYGKHGQIIRYIKASSEPCELTGLMNTRVIFYDLTRQICGAVIVFDEKHKITNDDVYAAYSAGGYKRINPMEQELLLDGLTINDLYNNYR